MPSHERPAWYPRENTFLSRLRGGGPPPVTLWVALGSADVVELIGAHQPAAVIIDREHTTNTLRDVQAMIVAAQLANVTPLVRVPRADRHEVGRLLDAGAQGIVFPMVSTVAEAREAANSVRYPPRGSRGWAGNHSRHTRWTGPHTAGGDGGLLSRAFVDAADATIATIFMIESPQGADEIDHILDTGQPDAVIFGWADCTVQAGFDTDRVQQSRTRVHDACRARGIGVTLGTSPEDMAAYYPGCFLSAGVDTTIFSESVAKRLDAFHAAADKLVSPATAFTSEPAAASPDLADEATR